MQRRMKNALIGGGDIYQNTTLYLNEILIRHCLSSADFHYDLTVSGVVPPPPPPLPPLPPSIRKKKLLRSTSVQPVKICFDYLRVHTIVNR